jgi:hypothetical protein
MTVVGGVLRWALAAAVGAARMACATRLAEIARYRSFHFTTIGSNFLNFELPANLLPAVVRETR